MTHAIVLIEAERDALSTLGGALADVDGVAEAYSVTGEWDFVAIVRVPRHEQLAEVDHRRASVQLEGVMRTQTMVAFEVFSQHDLEALFSIGGLAAVRLRLVLPAALEPHRAVLPVVDHQDRAGGREDGRADGAPPGGGQADGRAGGQERAGRPVVAALPGDPQAAPGTVVCEEIAAAA